MFPYGVGAALHGPYMGGLWIESRFSEFISAEISKHAYLRRGKLTARKHNFDESRQAKGELKPPRYKHLGHVPVTVGGWGGPSIWPQIYEIFDLYELSR